MNTWYTDGACSGNPGPGGFGVVAINENEQVEYCYSTQTKQTTNNREELKAILYILKNFGQPENSNPLVYSDSSYSVNTYNDWMFRWAEKDWIKADKKTPENLDIIKEYYNLIKKGYSINLKLIRGHNGILGNEIADKLATGAWDDTYVLKKYGI